MPLPDLWKLHTDFSIYHAALLLAGHDPQDYEDVSGGDVPRKAKGFSIARDAITNAVEAERLRAVKTVWNESDFGGEATLNIYWTLIRVEDLDAFVRAQGMICEAFARTASAEGPAFLTSSPYYPRKLDAANKAWAAVTSDPALLRGKSPKQALAKWLTDHAAELGLVNKDGLPNQTGIEEVCKVANWKPEGGATPTASGTATVTAPAVALTPTPPIRPRGPHETFDLDDEIPF